MSEKFTMTKEFDGETMTLSTEGTPCATEFFRTCLEFYRMSGYQNDIELSIINSWLGDTHLSFDVYNGVTVDTSEHKSFDDAIESFLKTTGTQDG